MSSSFTHDLILRRDLLIGCYWMKLEYSSAIYRSSRPEVLLGKGVVKICSKFTGEHPCRSAISIKLLCNCIEIALRHGCSPVNLLHIVRTLFPRNTSGWLLVKLLQTVTTKSLLQKEFSCQKDSCE